MRLSALNNGGAQPHNWHDNPPNRERLLSMKGVVQATGVSRSSIYGWMNVGLFPKPRKLGPRRVAWLASEVEAWMRSREVVRLGALLKGFQP